MALRKIVLQGEPCLTKKCRPVTEFNGRLHTLLDDLKDTLLDSGGVGLAAPQVTYILHTLKEKGFGVDGDATTMEEARDTILNVFRDKVKKHD